MPRKRKIRKQVAVEATAHRAAKRVNIPTAEDESLVPDGDRQPRPVRYPRNIDLDPQLVWRGKDEQDWSDLVVPAPPLYIQEKVEPKALVDDLLRETKVRRAEENPPQPSLFGDFKRSAGRRRTHRVLPAPRQLVEPDDPRRLIARDGEPC